MSSRVSRRRGRPDTACAGCPIPQQDYMHARRGSHDAEREPRASWLSVRGWLVEPVVTPHIMTASPAQGGAAVRRGALASRRGSASRASRCGMCSTVRICTSGTATQRSSSTTGASRPHRRSTRHCVRASVSRPSSSRAFTTRCYSRSPKDGRAYMAYSPRCLRDHIARGVARRGWCSLEDASDATRIWIAPPRA